MKRSLQLLNVGIAAVLLASCGSTSIPVAQTTTSPPTLMPRVGAKLEVAMRHLVDIDLVDKPPAATGEGAPGDMDLKGPHESKVISDPKLRALHEQQLQAAAAVTRLYPTLADAMRAGYIVTPLSEPGVGVHAVNWGLVAEFDAARPAMLLYSGTESDDHLLALSYYIVSAPDRQPSGFAGDNDHWHNHIDICIREGVLLPTTHQPKLCASEGGTYLTGRNLWMLHAWVVKSEPNPWGVFATYNPRYGDAEESEH